MRNRTICIVAMLCAATANAQTVRTVTLDDLFSLLESGDAVLQVRKSGTVVAERSLQEAKMERLPDANFSASATYNGDVVMMDRDFSGAVTFSSPHFGNRFAIEAEQVVYAGGTVSAAVKLAQTMLDKAGLEEEQVRQRRRFIALGKYLELVKTDNGIRVYESNVELCKTLISDVEAKRAEGMALRNDVVRHELQLEDIGLGLQKLRDNREILNHQLCNMLGLQGETIVPDSSILSVAMPVDSLDSWQSCASSSSLSMRLSELDAQAAGIGVDIAKGRRLPSVTLFAADNLSGPFTYDIPPVDNNFNIWYIGVGLRYSIGSLYKGGKAVRKAEAALLQSSDAAKAEAEAVDDSMHEAYVLYRQSFIDLRTRVKGVELADANYDVVNERYLNQLSLVTDMVDASNMKLEAELEEVNARVSVAFAYYRMKYIAGTL